MGRAINRGRRLSEERRRFGHHLILDDECGRNLDSAAVIDFYRTPGFEEIKPLYGLDRTDDPASLHRRNELFLQALAACHLERDTPKARILFEQCLEHDRNDEACRFYLGALAHTSVNMRSYYDV